jgi:DNA polymerase III subunit epsilon
MKTNISESELIDQLKITGNYKISKKLEPQESYNEDDGSEKKIAIFLDVETTGTEVAEDEIIELGMVAFEYNPDSGKIFKILSNFNELEEPNKPISPEASEVNGITMEMVKGYKIEDDKVENFISKAVLIISHNAKFDRQFVEQRFSCFLEKNWACSINDVSWKENGFNNRSLEFLAYKFDYFFDAHRAYIDCLASIHMLSQKLPKYENLVLQDLILNARQITNRISTKGIHISYKDKLKARGYKWNPKDVLWYLDAKENDTENELTWLKDKFNYDGKIIASFNATKRYSNRL